MTDESHRGEAGKPYDVDPDTAHPERIYNYVLGGDDNFAVDRQVAEEVFGAFPGGLASGRALLETLGRFVGRAVHFLGEEGIRQFLNVGTVFPMLESLHDLTRQAAPGAHVLYVVRDATVLAQAHRMVQSTPDGIADFVPSDLRDPDALVREAASVLDLERPVAVMVIGTLAYVRSERHAYRLVATLVEALPSGSYLALTHLASDLRVEEMAEASRRYRKRAATRELSHVPRSHDEVARFFEGLDLVDPGIVEVDRWRPGQARPRRPDAGITPVYGAVARKP